MSADGQSPVGTWGSTDSPFENSEANSKNYINVPYYIGVTLNKWTFGSMDNRTSGDSSRARAEYEVVVLEGTGHLHKGIDPSQTPYTAGQVIRTITTDEWGNADTGQIFSSGKYYVREKTPPVGYLKIDKTIPFGTGNEVGDKTYPFTGTPGAEGDPSMLDEQPILGGFQIRKVDADFQADNEKQGDASFAGAEFTVRNASQNAVEVKGAIYNPGEVITGISPLVKGKLKSKNSENYPFG